MRKCIETPPTIKWIGSQSDFAMIEAIINEIATASTSEKVKIKDVFLHTDFKNEQVNNLANHLALALAV